MITEEIINKWLSEVKSDLIDNYYRLKLKASGNWPNQLKEDLVIGKDKYNAIIWGEKYTGAIEYGRLPNKNQNTDYLRRWAFGFGNSVIKKWCQDKGIDTKFAVSIAYKIAKEGWKVPNPHNDGGLVSDVMNKKIPELEKALVFGFVEQIKTDLKNTLIHGYYSS